MEKNIDFLEYNEIFQGFQICIACVCRMAVVSLNSIVLKPEKWAFLAL